VNNPGNRWSAGRGTGEFPTQRAGLTSQIDVQALDEALGAGHVDQCDTLTPGGQPLFDP
jgi:hypothetical protein